MAATQRVTPRERTVEFTYETRIEAAPAGTNNLQLWVPVPHDSPFQPITQLTVQSPYLYRINTGPYGNRVLHLRLTHPSTRLS